MAHRGRLRADRREGLQHAERRRVPARIRYRPRRWLRAAAVHAEGQDRSSGTGDDEAGRPGEKGRSPSSYRRGVSLRADREPGGEPAMRVRLDGAGKPAVVGRATAQARARSRDGDYRMGDFEARVERTEGLPKPIADGVLGASPPGTRGWGGRVKKGQACREL